MPKCRVAKFENNACVVLDLIKEKRKVFTPVTFVNLSLFCPFIIPNFKKNLKVNSENNSCTILGPPGLK